MLLSRGRPMRGLGGRSIRFLVAALTASGLAGALLVTPADAVSTSTTMSTPGTTVTAAKAPLVGFDQQWDSSGGFDLMLSDANLATLKSMGATALRLPVKC